MNSQMNSQMNGPMKPMNGPMNKAAVTNNNFPTLATQLLLVFVMSLLPGFAAAQAAIELSDGVFTAEQADRGATEYRARCASCHAADLRGNSNSPSLLGLSFMFLWEGRSLGELFEKMSTEMPTDQPGSLSPQTYADLLAFLLRENSFPAGSTELQADMQALQKILIAAP